MRPGKSHISLTFTLLFAVLSVTLAWPGSAAAQSNPLLEGTMQKLPDECGIQRIRHLIASDRATSFASVEQLLPEFLTFIRSRKDLEVSDPVEPGTGGNVKSPGRASMTLGFGLQNENVALFTAHGRATQTGRSYRMIHIFCRGFDATVYDFLAEIPPVPHPGRIGPPSQSEDQRDIQIELSPECIYRSPSFYLGWGLRKGRCETQLRGVTRSTPRDWHIDMRSIDNRLEQFGALAFRGVGYESPNVSDFKRDGPPVPQHRSVEVESATVPQNCRQLLDTPIPAGRAIRFNGRTTGDGGTVFGSTLLDCQLVEGMGPSPETIPERVVTIPLQYAKIDDPSLSGVFVTKSADTISVRWPYAGTRVSESDLRAALVPFHSQLHLSAGLTELGIARRGRDGWIFPQLLGSVPVKGGSIEIALGIENEVTSIIAKLKKIDGKIGTLPHDGNCRALLEQNMSTGHPIAPTNSRCTFVVDVDNNSAAQLQLEVCGLRSVVLDSKQDCTWFSVGTRSGDSSSVSLTRLPDASESATARPYMETSEISGMNRVYDQIRGTAYQRTPSREERVRFSHDFVTSHPIVFGRLSPQLSFGDPVVSYDRPSGAVEELLIPILYDGLIVHDSWAKAQFYRSSSRPLSFELTLKTVSSHESLKKPSGDCEAAKQKARDSFKDSTVLVRSCTLEADINEDNAKAVWAVLLDWSGFGAGTLAQRFRVLVDADSKTVLRSLPARDNTPVELSPLWTPGSGAATDQAIAREQVQPTPVPTPTPTPKPSPTPPSESAVSLSELQKVAEEIGMRLGESEQTPVVSAETLSAFNALCTPEDVRDARNINVQSSLVISLLGSHPFTLERLDRRDESWAREARWLLRKHGLTSLDREIPRYSTQTEQHWRGLPVFFQHSPDQAAPYAEAMQAYISAANAGSGSAARRLSILAVPHYLQFFHLTKESVADGKTEDEWLRTAADLGDGESQYLLAQRKIPDAAKWLQSAADRGNMNACADLAKTLAQAGKTEEAAHYYCRAVFFGDHTSLAPLRKLRGTIK